MKGTLDEPLAQQEFLPLQRIGSSVLVLKDRTTVTTPVPCVSHPTNSIHPVRAPQGCISHLH